MKRPYIITIASEKGGVGKTTLATNLAIYLKGLAEELPVTIFSFDNHFTVDQMFRIGKIDHNQHVGQLFAAANLADLLTDGQYGVNYIPSSRKLFVDQLCVQGVEHLARNIGRSTLAGIVIIDTSPTLDIYTRNALFAADRVIVPIKDAPSLENCRNLTNFMVQNKRSKTVMKLLPCLIDTRIQFDGPFRNSYQLLKAYAINRGYRCFEGFIAKSPKVESLSTNPEGKIYPVITRGRKTDVHLQLTHLARQVYLDYLEYGPIRLNEVAGDLFDQEEISLRDYEARIANLQTTCLCCNTTVPKDKIWSNAYFMENETGSFSGFIEEGCFIKLLLHDCYPELNNKKQQKLLPEILSGAAGKTFLLLQKKQIDQEQDQIDLFRLDQHGEKVSGRQFLLKKKRPLLHRERIGLLQLFKLASKTCTDSLQQLLILQTGEHHLDLLKQQNYLKWKTIFNRLQIDNRLDSELS